MWLSFSLLQGHKATVLPQTNLWHAPFLPTSPPCTLYQPWSEWAVSSSHRVWSGSAKVGCCGTDDTRIVFGHRHDNYSLLSVRFVLFSQPTLLSILDQPFYDNTSLVARLSVIIPSCIYPPCYFIVSSMSDSTNLQTWVLYPTCLISTYTIKDKNKISISIVQKM